MNVKNACAALYISIVCLSSIYPAPSYALTIGDFTGYSQGLGRGGDVVVNFAVLPPGDAFLPLLSDSFRPGTGATDLDSHQYTYLYQLANNSGPRVFDFLLPDTVKATTVGSFDNGTVRLGFLDQGVAVGAGSLSQSRCSLSGPLCPGDGPGGNLDGAKNLGIAGSTVSEAQRVTVSTALIPQRTLDWTFTSAQAGQALAPGLTSPLFGYQSSNGPIIGNAGVEIEFHGTGTRPDAIFGIPVAGAAAPEPMSVLLFGSGFGGFIALRKWRPFRAESPFTVVGSRRPPAGMKATTLQRPRRAIDSQENYLHSPARKGG